MHSVYDLGMLRSLRRRILRSVGYLVFSDFEEFWGQQTAGCYRLVCCYKLCTVPMAKFRCTLARSNVLYHRVPMQQLCPCTVPMYHVPCPCTKNVVPILAADLYEIAADLAAKSAAISQRSAARIGTTFLVHGHGTWYMGTVHGT